MRHGRRSFGTHTRRRVVVIVLLVGQLFSAVGMPLPAAPVPKDLSQPFPCMNNPCGCSNAEACWRSCCCTTLAERLAWAREHGVEPPEYVREEVEHSSDGDCDPGAPNCPHCKKKHDHKSAAAQPPCVRWVLGIAARRCHGDGPMAFFADTPALPASAPLTIAVRRPSVPRIAVAAERRPTIAHQPPSPPPRSIG
jgi:hypothetical protein